MEWGTFVSQPSSVESKKSQ